MNKETIDNRLKHIQKVYFTLCAYQEYKDPIELQVSPSDSVLISGGSEERRRFIDVVISQFDSMEIDKSNYLG